uniref:Peptidoglycan bridge formation glycyltransferase FemA/FemB family protein n=1 Tax=candidate division CPR3 bacterium TaxID=2268181 RepID=A0A7C4M2I0_UNCC3
MQISNFLQSEEWAEFEKSQGSEIFWIDGILLTKNHLPKGKSYLYCPRGPEELTEDFVKAAHKLARKERSIFIRVEPLNHINIKTHKHTIKKTININPANTLILDLTKSEETLLSAMKQKTRYNINLAKKKGVDVEISSGVVSARTFFEIMKETSSRDNFNPHSLKHYEDLTNFFGPKKMLKVYLAKIGGKYIAANIIFYYKNTATYLHGASSNEYRNVMAPYLLQWQAILDAKKEGFKYYDFWGIAPDDSPGHPWAGVTRFKKGFGGEQMDYPGTYDLVISKYWYFIYKVVRFLNRLF